MYLRIEIVLPVSAKTTLLCNLSLGGKVLSIPSGTTLTSQISKSSFHNYIHVTNKLLKGWKSKIRALDKVSKQLSEKGKKSGLIHLFLEELDVVRLVNNVAFSISSVVRTLKINRMFFKFQFKDFKSSTRHLKIHPSCRKTAFLVFFLVSSGIQPKKFHEDQSGF